MSMFANGALQMRVRKHQNETSDHHAEVEVSFFTTAGRTDFTFTKTDIPEAEGRASELRLAPHEIRDCGHRPGRERDAHAHLA